MTRFRKQVEVVMVVASDAMQKRAEKRESIEKLLDQSARTTATLKGIPFAQAYDELLKSDAGREAYSQLYDLSVDTERVAALPVAAKLEGSAASATLAKAASIDAQLDGLAKARAERTGEDQAVAYSRVLESAEGRKLYFEHCELMASVGV